MCWSTVTCRTAGIHLLLSRWQQNLCADCKPVVNEKFMWSGMQPVTGSVHGASQGAGNTLGPDSTYSASPHRFCSCAGCLPPGLEASAQEDNVMEDADGAQGASQPGSPRADAGAPLDEASLGSRLALRWPTATASCTSMCRLSRRAPWRPQCRTWWCQMLLQARPSISQVITSQDSRFASHCPVCRYLQAWHGTTTSLNMAPNCTGMSAWFCCGSCDKDATSSALDGGSILFQGQYDMVLHGCC